MEKPLMDEIGVQIPQQEINKTVQVAQAPEVGWNWGLLQQSIPRQALEKLRSLVLDLRDTNHDYICWGFHSPGQFEVQSAYDALHRWDSSTEERVERNMEIPRLGIPRWKSLLWIIKRDRLLTNLSSYGT
jgi:hypothetical protein